MYAKLTIPERLKDLRVVDKHLTQEQLAEQTGLSKSALGKYETDDYKDISPFASRKNTIRSFLLQDNAHFQSYCYIGQSFLSESSGFFY